MWAAHFTVPAFLLKFFYPGTGATNTPTSLLSFAGALPDFTFFLLSILGSEHIVYKPNTYRGCFKYDAGYPWSHSLTGQVGLGLVLGLFSVLVGGLPESVILPVILASASHFLLDLPVHRRDMFLSPYDHQPIKKFSYNLLDNPQVIFGADFLMTLGTLFLHYWKNGRKETPNVAVKYLTLAGFLSLIQADFTYGLSVNLLPASAKDNALVHAPLFMGQILITAYLVGKIVDGNALGEMHMKVPHLDGITEKTTSGIRYGNRGTAKNLGNPGKYGHAHPNSSTDPDSHPDVPHSKIYDIPHESSASGPEVYSDGAREPVTERPSRYSKQVPTHPREPQSELEKSYDPENTGVRREDRGTGMHSGRVGVHPDLENFHNATESNSIPLLTPPFPPNPVAQPHSIPLPTLTNSEHPSPASTPALVDQVSTSTGIPESSIMAMYKPASSYFGSLPQPQSEPGTGYKKLQPAAQGRHLSITLNTGSPKSNIPTLTSNDGISEVGRPRRESIHKPMSPTLFSGNLDKKDVIRFGELGRDRGNDKEVRVRLVQQRGRE